MPEDIKIRPCGEGQSFFNFISDYWKASIGNDRAFHRICSLMRKMNAQNIIIEKYGTFEDKEVEEEKESLQKSLKTKLSFDIFRFTFLRKEINRIDEIYSLEQHNFLGNVILVNLQRPDGSWTSYILKSIITFPSKDGSSGLLNNYLHVINDFELEVSVGDKKTLGYKIKGTYFAQQNGITSVCAHSCLKMLINNKQTGTDFLTTQDINKTLGFTPEVLAKEALTIKHFQEIIKYKELNSYQLDCFKYPNSDYAEFLYKLIESRFPSALIFTTKTTTPSQPPESHVVYAFGHTLNTDIWKTQAEFSYPPILLPNVYRSSSSYVDHFIIHDDNLGMYLALQVDALRKVTLPYKDPYFRALYVLGVVNKEIELNSDWAEGAAVVILNNLLSLYEEGGLLNQNSNKWLDRLAGNNNRPWITRITLNGRESYRDHLKKSNDFLNTPFNHDNAEINLITNELPEKFWLIEISLPDLYTTNKTKLVDIIYSVTDISNIDEKLSEEENLKRKIFDNCILIRLPGILVFLQKTAAAKETGTDIKRIFSLGVKEHFPLFRFKSDIIVPEW